jgi:hypothetical protein
MTNIYYICIYMNYQNSWLRKTRKRFSAATHMHDIFGQKKKRQEIIQQPKLEEFTRQNKRTVVIMIDMHGGDYIKTLLPKYIRIKNTVVNEVGHLGLCNYSAVDRIPIKVYQLKESFKDSFVYGIENQESKNKSHYPTHYLKSYYNLKKEFSPRSVEYHENATTSHHQIRSYTTNRNYSLSNNFLDLLYMGFFIINTFNLNPEETQIYNKFINSDYISPSPNLTYKKNVDNLLTLLHKDSGLIDIGSYLNLKEDRSKTSFDLSSLLLFFEELGFEYIHIIDYSCRVIHEYPLIIDKKWHMPPETIDTGLQEYDDIRKVSSKERKMGSHQIDSLFSNGRTFGGKNKCKNKKYKNKCYKTRKFKTNSKTIKLSVNNKK